ncbi:MAG: thioredoxin domain-containing protein [Candidatus Aenigmatarchaeota archaeon]
MPEGKRIRIPKIVIWQVITLVFAVLLLGVIFGKIPLIGTSSANSVTVGNKTVDYINKNLIQSGAATLVSVQDMGTVFKVTTSYQGQEIPVFVTKDGNLLFISQPTDMTKSVETTSTTTTSQEMVKSEKPAVELYVMSFCPYGVQAETLMKPVFDLLGSKADIKIRFIANVGGTTVDSVQSLHGISEAKEDLRQICIMKNYNAKTYWSYLQTFNSNCYSSSQNATALEACWKSTATSAGIDTAKIETCAYGSEGLNLLKADEALTTKYGISGSPTILINSVQFSGSRSSEAFKQAICSAFNTPPAECSQTLGSTTTESAPAGGCG